MIDDLYANRCSTFVFADTDTLDHDGVEEQDLHFKSKQWADLNALSSSHQFLCREYSAGPRGYILEHRRGFQRNLVTG